MWINSLVQIHICVKVAEFDTYLSPMCLYNFLDDSIVLQGFSNLFKETSLEKSTEDDFKVALM